MPKPLIIHVLWSLEPGGAEHLVLWLSDALMDYHFRVKVIAAGGLLHQAMQGGEMQEEFERSRIPLAIGPETFSFWQRDRTVRFLRQQLLKERPDILHTHLGADVWAGYVAMRRNIHPWVTTLHSDESVLLTGMRKRMKTWALRRADAVVAVSEAVEKQAVEAFGVSHRKISVIRTGIPLGRYYFRGTHAWEDIPRLMTVGRLVPEKGVDILLQALAQIKAPWTLDMVGDGPERSNLQALSVALGIMPRVHFLGSRSNVPELLAQADIFCFPSLSEGQGIAALEAAASGVPILMSDLPALREAFDASMATFVEPGSVSAWTMAFQQVLRSGAAQLAQAQHARTHVRSEFSLQRMVEEYIALYRSLLDGRGS